MKLRDKGIKEIENNCFFLKEYNGNFRNAVWIPNIAKIAPNLRTETTEDNTPTPSASKKYPITIQKIKATALRNPIVIKRSIVALYTSCFQYLLILLIT